MSVPILEIKNLSVIFDLPDGRFRAVSDLDLTLGKQQIIGLVGESGSGKSVTCRAILGLLPALCTVSGEIDFLCNGRTINLLRQGKGIRSIRGREIAMIFQEPFAAFSPVHRI